MKFADLKDGAADTMRNVGAFAHDLAHPTVRLGVTGLARAGKTVFITALIQNLMAGGRMAFFDAVAQGRVTRVYLEPQPDDAVPRFDYERHLAALTGTPPTWPESTRQLSQLRLTLEYVSQGALKRRLGRGKLHVDIVDYPGEWLLDLPLLGLGFETWSAQALTLSRARGRTKLAKDWHALLAEIDAEAPADEQVATRAAECFTAYLKACRTDPYALSTVPPGRFLMPGDLAGSPALTFAPLIVPEDGTGTPGSLWAMMARRFESYKTHVVKPFFRDHFARLDRQIVLVDALAALNAGPGAVADLEHALGDILACFRPGARSWLNTVLRRRIDRIVIAATKADHLHQSSHDRLEAIVARLTESAIERARFAGAEVRAQALAGVRATREGEVRQGGDTLPCIIGVPLAGEKLGRRTFDGEEEFAVFPGDLPEDPDAALSAPAARGRAGQDVRFIRFRPPDVARSENSAPAALPHIRLDRALDFLLGDRLA